MLPNILHPGLIMILFGVVILITPEKWKLQKPLQILGPICACIGLAGLNESSTLTYALSESLSIELMHVDRLAMAFMIIFCFIAVCTAIYGIEIQHKKEAAMCMMYAGSMMSVVLAGDLISFIVFWEVAAFASTYIVYAKHCRKSSRAAFRYLLVHSFGGNLLLVGFIFQIYNHGTDIVCLTGGSGMIYWLVLLGIAVNAAIPPLNGWLADAYPESTIGGTPYLASFTTKAAIYALIRFFAGTELLIWFGVAMAIFAALMALLENDIRRLLSHHIVSQLGMMVAALGAGEALGIDGATAHAITNILYKGVLMMVAGAVIYVTGKRKVTELGGMYKKMPLMSICFLIASLAIAGLPFTAGFASKALMVEALEEGGFELAALGLTVAGVGTLLSITLKLNYFVFFGKTDNDVKLERKLPVTMQAAIIIATIGTLFVGFVPGALYGITPSQSTTHVFALGHILEYVAIFSAGTIPFVLYIKKMAPHDEISIDFDWIYRRPIFHIIRIVSSSVHNFMIWCDKHVMFGVGVLREHVGEPTMITKKSRSVVIRSMSFDNEDRAIGDVIQVAVMMVAVMLALLPVIL